MDNLHQAFYNELLNYEKKIKDDLGIDIHIDKIDNNNELVNYIEKIISKNGGRGTFTKLWSKGRLDLTIEFLVLQEKYKVLFSDTIIEKSKNTLHQYGYEF